MADEPLTSSPLVERLTRIAVILALVGLGATLVFLWTGFNAWSVGLGAFFGMPILIGAILIYVIAVILDLRQRDVL